MVRGTRPGAAPDAPSHDGRRRAVCAGLAAVLLVPDAVTGRAARAAAAPVGPARPASPAMARLGARLASDLPPATLADLRGHAAALHGMDDTARGSRRISAPAASSCCAGSRCRAPRRPVASPPRT